MNGASLSRGPSTARTSLNIVSVLLMIALMTTWSGLALSAESEPMVSLPGGVPPQAAELLAGATPAKADMLLHIRIYLQLRDKQAAEKMNEDLYNGASPNYHKWLNPQKFDEMLAHFKPATTPYQLGSRPRLSP